MRTNWRDSQGWIDSSLPLTTTSNEVCKLYDATLSQLSSLYDEPSVGGMNLTSEKMLEADPDFVMGHALVNSMKIGGSFKSLDKNEELQKSIETMVQLAEKNRVTDREMKHVNAVKLISEGNRYEAVQIYRDILKEHPTDLAACRQAVFTYYTLGMAKDMLNMMSDLLQQYKTSTPGYSNVSGWTAFALEENKLYDKAEEQAFEALQHERRETFAIHTLAHVYLERGSLDTGIRFMESRADEWGSCKYLVCHNAWHVALFHIENGNFAEALQVFDKEILTRAKHSEAEGNFNDAASLLYRLSLEGIDVNGRWKEVAKLSEKFYGVHGWVNTDAHVLFSLFQNKDNEKAKKMISSLKTFVQEGCGDNWKISRDVGIPLFEGISAFENGEFEAATEQLKSIKHELNRIGGSIAQRDVFIQLLLHSAIRSANPEHTVLVRELLEERKKAKVEDSLGKRLLTQLSHVHSSS